MSEKTSASKPQPDLENAEYVLFIGHFPGANGHSFQAIGKRAVHNTNEGGCHIDVVDPVLSNGCVTSTGKNTRWIPIKPATNAALALGIGRWIIENEAYNAPFLSFPNYEAGVAGGYASYSNASHLVIVDENHPNYLKLMRAADAGIEEPPVEVDADADKTAKPDPNFVVIDRATGQPALHKQCSDAEFDYEGEVNGVKVRSSFQIYRDNAFALTLDEVEEITGVPVDTIASIGKELTSHGVHAVARLGYGGSATVNGCDAVNATAVLNAMIGSNQMVGGNANYGNAPITSGNGARYKLSEVPGKPKVSAANATYISRTKKSFEDTDEYKRRVAEGETDPQPLLPWFSAATSADNQALASVVNQYPYQAKIMLAWETSPTQATPGAMRDMVLDRLKDPEVVPLIIACDVIFGEIAQIADYIIPDTNPFESFGMPTIAAGYSGKGTAVRWPAVTPGSLQLPDGGYASWEAFCTDVALACDLPGFGDDAIIANDGTTWPLYDACDYYLKSIANLAYAETPVDDISANEVHIQGLDALPAGWEKAVSAEEWPKVLNVISRGGRFWPIETSVTDEGRSPYAKEFVTYLYSEARAAIRKDYSDVRLSGAAQWIPEDFADRTPMTDLYSPEEWPFRGASYKSRFRSVSMLANSPIMRDVCEKNFIEISLEDAKEFGIEDGDTIRVTSPTGDPCVGEAMVRAGIAPRTFGVAFGYAHRAYGSQDNTIDGELREGNPDIASDVRIETMLDPTVSTGDTFYPIADIVCSSPGRNGGMFKIEKA